MTFRPIFSAATAAVALALAAAPVATLTAPSAAAQGAEGAQDAQGFSDAKLDLFTETLLDVSEVRNKYMPALQAAETEQQQEAIIKQANAEIVTVIETAEGLSVDEYLEIAQAASQDQTLNARIVQRVEAMEGVTR